jgi:hypothetical protein
MQQDKEHKEQEDRWAAARAASPDKDAALALLETTIRGLEAALAERSQVAVLIVHLLIALCLRACAWH